MTSGTRTATAPDADAGTLIRHWRTQRRLTQQDLALQADISTRHLSFVETGRSRPTPDMILRLAEQMDVPLRHRNDILLAAGWAPAYPETPLQGPGMSVIGAALRQILDGHHPYPAVAVDRHWELLDGNTAVDLLTAGSAHWLLEPPVNVLRLSLHPDGVAGRIRNLPDWRSHVLARLDHQIRTTGDAVLAELRNELAGYPGGVAELPVGSLVVPLEIDAPGGPLSFISTTTVFGTPLDVTVAELAIESFFPADSFTAEAVRAAG